MTEREKQLCCGTEDGEQTAVISWCRLMETRWPELRLIHHIPNGGKRSKSEAARFRAMGVLPGVADLFLPAPKAGYHGLYIEMKTVVGRISAEQKRFLTAAAEQGFCCCACFGAEAAIGVLKRYLSGEVPAESEGVKVF